MPTLNGLKRRKTCYLCELTVASNLVITAFGPEGQYLKLAILQRKIR